MFFDEFMFLFCISRWQQKVGNKNDDPQRKVVVTEDAQAFADRMAIKLFETSAKDNLNVEEMFNAITRMVLSSKKVIFLESD